MGDDEKRSDGKLIEIDRCSTEEGRSATRNCVRGVFGMRLVNCAVLLSKDQAHSEMGTSQCRIRVGKEWIWERYFEQSESVVEQGIQRTRTEESAIQDWVNRDYGLTIIEIHECYITAYLADRNRRKVKNSQICRRKEIGKDIKENIISFCLIYVTRDWKCSRSLL